MALFVAASASPVEAATGSIPSAAHSTASGRGRQRQRIIVDTDIGNFSDDFWALSLLLSHPTIEISLIVTSGGDTSAKLRILSKFLAHTGNAHVPIGAGPNSTEDGFLAPGPDGHTLKPVKSADVPGAVPNPIMGEWARVWDPESEGRTVHWDGIAAMAAALEDATKPVAAILVLGTTENVGGHLLDRDEGILRRTKTPVVSMGGTLNSTGDSEYNYMLQPNSTRRLFEASDDVTVVPVGVSMERLTLGGLFNRTSYAKYLRGDSLVAMALAQAQLALSNFGTHHEVATGTTDLLFDSVAAYVLLGTLGLGNDPKLYNVTEACFDMKDSGLLLRKASCPPKNWNKIKVVTGWSSPRANLDFADFLAGVVAQGRERYDEALVACGGPPSSSPAVQWDWSRVLACVQGSA